MVNSVLAVSTIGKTKHDDVKSDHSLQERKQMNSNPLFSQILQEEVEEQRSASLNCHTLTYGQDSRLHAFEYQKREYHY